MNVFLRYFVLSALLLMALFLVQRHLFLAFNYPALQGVPGSGIWASHRRALAMDVSTAGYVLLVLALLYLPLLFIERRGLYRAGRLFIGAFIVLSALVNVVDIALFDAWGVKIDRKALSYLRYPSGLLGATSPGRTATLLLLAAIQSVLFLFLLGRIDRGTSFRKGPLAGRITVAVLVPGLCMIAMRGGVQDLPISKSWSWLSTRPVLNQAAMNSMWNLMEVAAKPAEFTSNPYDFMPRADAQRLVAASRTAGTDASPSFSTTPRPNVLLIMLESWTADVIQPLGGDSGVAPAFTRLCEDGLLFTNFYSTGFRTEQGLAAMVSGFPSQPTTTIIRKYGKFDHLPSLTRALDSVGYSSRYYYGGDVEFANTRAYLESMGFGTILGEHSFPIRQRTRWGAFDEELFDFYLRDGATATPPFLHLIMTSTSHEPFNAPVDEGFSGSEPDMYRNTIHYTDRCLGAFIEEAKGQPWWANTLVFIVADHGHYLPHYRLQYSDARHRIPFLVTGGALKEAYRGERNDTYGSHVDFPVTLLALMGLPHGSFQWGRNLLGEGVAHHAFWTFNNGFGIADSTQQLVFDAEGGRLLELRDSTRTADKDRLEALGKAKLQVLLDEYIHFDQ